MPAVYFCELLSATTMSQLELENQGNKNGGKNKMGANRLGGEIYIKYGTRKYYELNHLQLLP